MADFDQFERRLAAALRSDADMNVDAFETGAIARAAIAGTGRRALRVPYPSSRPVGRSGRSRGIALLAAAAVLLIGGAWAAGSSGLRLPAIVPPVPGPSFGVDATASPAATSPSPSDPAGPSPSVGPTASSVTSPTGVWIPTGPMGTPRSRATAVRLLDGRVLVVGGEAGDPPSPSSAELYDPDTGTWSGTGNMVHPQAGFPATLLRDGRVLVGDVHNPAARVWNTGAEVYDPDTGTWSSVGKVFHTEAWLDGATATLLDDGKVLVAGQGGAKLYDPDSGTWSATGTMIEPRHHHTATLLPDGKVLVAGGTDGRDGMVYSAELYDPVTGSWSATAHTHRDGPCRAGCPHGGGTATLLADGTVLFVRATPDKARAEIYHPATGTWTQTVDRPDGVFSTLTPLLDGRVLAAGGMIPPKTVTAEVYDPATGSWTETANMPYLPASATLLDDGTVLVAGGTAFDPTGSTVLLYVPAGVTLPEPGPATESPAGPG